MSAPASSNTPEIKLHLVDSQNNLPKWRKALVWLDQYVLLLITGFLLAFIPLYPKLPLAELIPGYIVRLRLEDIFVGVAIVIYGVQVWRKKAEWKSPLTWLIVAYAIGGILSTLSGIFLTHTIPMQPLHVGKSLLHYFRYLEYFSLFFVTYGAIRNKRDIQILLLIFVLTVLLISGYGYGQKFFYWPVYSTMNREFSKGLRLYLTEHARVQSTFGGHYDMAAYLVIALPMLLAQFFLLTKKVWKIFMGLSFLIGSWLLIMSASRTSFVAFLVGIGIVLALIALKKPRWQQKISWGFSRSLGVYFLVFYMFFTFGDSIYERFLQTIDSHPMISEPYHAIDDKRQEFYDTQIEPALNGEGVIYEIKVALKLALPKAQKPKNGISTEELEQKILVSSDERPVATRPADVYVDVPDIIYETTVSGGVATTTATEKPRGYSDNALKYGLSVAIRLDTLWPQAIAGFKQNPLLGTGYATLTKSSVDQFTEAESTDNNFLRTLGETGSFGFVTFYGVIAVAMYLSLRAYLLESDQFVQVISLGFLGAAVGLLVNAAYIDVYASSKVAFSFWILTGMIVAGIKQSPSPKLK